MPASSPCPAKVTTALSADSRYSGQPVPCGGRPLARAASVIRGAARLVSYQIPGPVTTALVFHLAPLLA